MKLALAVLVLCAGCSTRTIQPSQTFTGNTGSIAVTDGHMVFCGCKEENHVYTCTFVCVPIGAVCSLPDVSTEGVRP